MEINSWLDERTDTASLSPTERRTLARIFERIDVVQGSAFLDYGLAVQVRFSGLADDIAARLDASRGPRANVTRLLAKVCHLDPNGARPRGIELPLLAGWSDDEDGWLGRYESIRARLDRLVPDLHSAAGWIAHELALLDRLAAKARLHLQELDLLILAGEAKTDELRGDALPRLARRVDDAVDSEAFERLRWFSERIEKFERRVAQLEAVRAAGDATLPQIRAGQHDLETLLEQAQRVVATTIPLWKHGVFDAVTSRRSTESAELGQALTRTLLGVQDLAAEAGPAGAADAGLDRSRPVQAAPRTEIRTVVPSPVWRRALRAPQRALREALGGMVRFGN